MVFPLNSGDLHAQYIRVRLAKSLYTVDCGLERNVKAVRFFEVKVG